MRWRPPRRDHQRVDDDRPVSPSTLILAPNRGPDSARHHLPVEALFRGRWDCRHRLGCTDVGAAIVEKRVRVVPTPRDHRRHTRGQRGNESKRSASSKSVVSCTGNESSPQPPDDGSGRFVFHRHYMPLLRCTPVSRWRITLPTRKRIFPPARYSGPHTSKRSSMPMDRYDRQDTSVD